MGVVAVLSGIAALSGFVLLLFIASRYVPGPRLAGVARAGEPQFLYRLNGLAIFAGTVACAVLLEAAGAHVLLWINTHFLALFVAANLFAFTASAWLYLRGNRDRTGGAHGARALLLDYFCGVELNPRMAGVDLKLFSYRPSLVGLALINLSFAAVQWHRHGAISDAMLLYQLLTLAYVFNYFQFEYGMLHTWDIVAERFGWMLVWGDYVLVPFFYCLPAWFLVDQTAPLPAWHVALVLLLSGAGFWLFRGANEQKHRFKRDPAALIWGRPARTIGGRLLVSGFWGIGRHLNYTGEILVYVAFALSTGFASWIPYVLPLWLTLLLVHRAWRDETRCRDKYGATWDEYRRHARFRMVPFLY